MSAYDLADFQSDVLDRSQTTPVLVDFWAAWCGPCKMLGPVVERLAAQADGRWRLVKIDTEAHPDLAARFGIRGIPNLKLFHRGEIVAELAGALPEPQLRAWLDQHLPTPKRDQLAQARTFLRAGRAAAAAALLAPLAAAAPADHEVAALAARALAFTDPAAALPLADRVPPGSAWADDASLASTLASAFRADGPALPESPLRPRYLDAVALLRRESFDAGLAALIAVLMDRPDYADGRAKALCLAIFRHLGLRHPIVENHSRAFGMAVNC